MIRTFVLALFYIFLATAILFLSHYNYLPIALALAMLPAAGSWWRHGRSVQALVPAVPKIVFGVSVATLIGLNQQPTGQPIFPLASQATLAAFYAGWLTWLHVAKSSPDKQLMVAAVNQFFIISAIFLAAAFWHWPGLAVVVASWFGSYLVAYWLLSERSDQNAGIFAVIWALVVAEMAWVFNSWLVNYVIAGGYAIVPQAALIIMGLGYCFASVYQAHQARSLSKRRLVEYILIGVIMLAIVVAGTRWSGTV
ncbi:MAG TPA: hypothetical protein VNA68_01045 [Candidatus Dormibacteraeota bacterium]|nr:hypothetical protein [Candidatus Dormibacteraeota bacterium]